MIILDTHIFIWRLLDDPKLPSVLRGAIERNPEEVYVPSICIWEGMLLAEKGRIDFHGRKPDRLLRGYLQSSGFKEAPLTAEISMLSRTLEFGHQDPADRFIAATAYEMKGLLATSDRDLRALSWVRLAY